MDSENKNSVPAQELELIGKYARKALTQEEIYTFSVILCDNEIDRDNEKFTVSALRTAVVRRKRIYLGYSRHSRNKGRTDRAS